VDTVRAARGERIDRGALVLADTAQVVPAVQSCRSGSVVVACSTATSPSAALNFRGQRSLEESAAGVNKMWQRVRAPSALGGVRNAVND
jgi:hypothetical protein